MLITVTQAHIDEGMRRHRHRCPVALAMRKAMNRNDIEVYSNFAGVPNGPTWNLPYEAQKFIDAFDMHQRVAPFEFLVSEAI